jgi:DNA-binding GntR family transcriptional regulator
MGRANQDHAEIMDAYRRADVKAAVDFSKHHLRATLEAIEEQEAATDSARDRTPSPGRRRRFSS